MKKTVNLQKRERRVVENHDALIRETAGTIQAGPDRDVRLVGKPTGKYGKDGVMIYDDHEVVKEPGEPTRAAQLAELCETYGGSYKIKGGSDLRQLTRIEFTFSAGESAAETDDVEFDDDPNALKDDDIEGDKIVGRGETHQEAIDDLRARLVAYGAALGDANKSKATKSARKSGGSK